MLIDIITISCYSHDTMTIQNIFFLTKHISFFSLSKPHRA